MNSFSNKTTEKTEKERVVMEEIITVQNQYYILATSSRVDEHSRVLKQGDAFAVFDRFGNVRQIGLGEQGLYQAGTRFLSRLDLRLGESRPLLLSSTVKEDNALLTVDLTNPDIARDGEVVLPRDSVHIFRGIFLWNDACYHRLRLRNYLPRPVEIVVTLSFEADYADIFEVRGLKRERRGELLTPVVGPDHVELAYRGLDEQVRRTRLHFLPQPAELHATRAEYRETLLPHGERSYFLTVGCDSSEGRAPPVSYSEAFDAAAAELREFRSGDAAVRTSNEQFNDWLNRSYVDLHLMVTHTPHGPYPYAGVPWFSTVFGRDGLITALEFLWINPELARGVFNYLAATQSTTTNAAQDAEPGKILHETRGGEMAALGEIPFGQYYGSVDATPLFVMLAGAYYERTADREFLQFVWPHVLAALDWIDRFGDIDGDGFVEYAQRSPRGLSSQGWKDSHDSIFHADGTLAEGPVALCEVQSYVFAARRAAAEMAQALGEHEKADLLLKQAEELRRSFEAAFWCEDISTYAIALDGRKRPCRVRTSNPGHCLFAGIVSPERAARVADTLLSDAMFSGWGVRTVAETEPRYNPMSYHNGSVWPHDNAIIAAGLARYRLMDHVLKIVTGLFDASLFVDLHRLPELFCGFVRRSGEGPTLYPVACAPQSWAGAAVFLLLQSMLGLRINAPARRIQFAGSVLPESLQRVWVHDLRVADASVDLALARFPIDVGIELLSRRGEVEVMALK
jgi:glycogen debranching enzyme